jgi:hypothetical protein
VSFTLPEKRDCQQVGDKFFKGCPYSGYLLKWRRGFTVTVNKCAP